MASLGTHTIFLAVGTFIGLAWQGQQVTNADKISDGYKADIARLQGELDEVSALKERMDAIDDQFSEQTVEKLESQLGMAPGEVEMVAPTGQSDAWDQVFSAFTKGGWKVSTTDSHRDWSNITEFANASSQPTVLLSVGDNEAGRAVKLAFDAAAIPYVEQSIKPGEPSIPQVWVVTSADVEPLSDAILRKAP